MENVKIGAFDALFAELLPAAEKAVEGYRMWPNLWVPCENPHRAVKLLRACSFADALVPPDRFPLGIQGAEGYYEWFFRPEYDNVSLRVEQAGPFEDGSGPMRWLSLVLHDPENANRYVRFASQDGTAVYRWSYAFDYETGDEGHDQVWPKDQPDHWSDELATIMRPIWRT